MIGPSRRGLFKLSFFNTALMNFSGRNLQHSGESQGARETERRCQQNLKGVARMDGHSESDGLRSSELEGCGESELAAGHDAALGSRNRTSVVGSISTTVEPEGSTSAGFKRRGSKEKALRQAALSCQVGRTLSFPAHLGQSWPPGLLSHMLRLSRRRPGARDLGDPPGFDPSRRLSRASVPSH